MSTPRTDALLTTLLYEQGFVDHTNAPERWVKLARELEEELKAITAERNEWSRSFEVQGETAGPQQCKGWWDRNAFIHGVSDVTLSRLLAGENNALKVELAALKSPAPSNPKSEISNPK